VSIDRQLSVIAPTDLEMASFPEIASQQKMALLERLKREGALLFRGFDIRSAEDFDRFIGQFGLVNFPYEASFSNAVRRNRTERVFTANEAPPDVEIFLHHEMAQTLIFPEQLFFFCEQPPAVGGSTPICWSDLSLQTLEQRAPKFVQRLRDRGIRYRNTMPAYAELASAQGRSWKDTLKVESAEQAEQKLTSLGYDYQWLNNGYLSVRTPPLAAIQAFDQHSSFFNQIVAAYVGWQSSLDPDDPILTYGDGSHIAIEDLELAVEVCYQHVVDLDWQQGDVALLDNTRVMHGRRPYQGARTVLASLCSPIRRSSMTRL
jgi:alpha-ketoglutarate-dependent taurine dioxygenase